MGCTVGYARVSSSEQAENQEALRQQINRLEQAGIDQLYQDVESGTNSNRVGFKKILSLVNQGLVDRIIATRWDRLTREYEAYLNLKTILRESGVKLKLLDQGGDVDLNTAAGELSADMQAIFAVHESRMLTERVQRGHQYRRQKKVAWTRSPWGYTIVDNQYVLNKEPIICLLKDRPANYLQLNNEPSSSEQLVRGISKFDIARDLIEVLLEIRRPRQALKQMYLKYGTERKNGKGSGRKGRSTNPAINEQLLFFSSASHVKDWVHNPVLRGHTAYLKYIKKGSMKDPKDWEIHNNTHPNEILITNDEFNELQLIFQSNVKNVGPRTGVFFLTGLVICDECGHKCILKRGPQHKYYGCRNSQIGCSNSKCVRVERIEEAIIAKLFKRAMAILPQEGEQSANKLESLELTNLKKQLASLKEVLKIDPEQEDIKQTIYRLEKRIEQILLNLDYQKFRQASAQQIITCLEAKSLIFWYSLKTEEREIIYEKLVSNITISNEGVKTVCLTI